MLFLRLRHINLVFGKFNFGKLPPFLQALQRLNQLMNQVVLLCAGVIVETTTCGINAGFFIWEWGASIKMNYTVRSFFFLCYLPLLSQHSWKSAACSLIQQEIFWNMLDQDNLEDFCSPIDSRSCCAKCDVHMFFFLFFSFLFFFSVLFPPCQFFFLHRITRMAYARPCSCCWFVAPLILNLQMKAWTCCRRQGCSTPPARAPLYLI